LDLDGAALSHGAMRIHPADRACPWQLSPGNVLHRLVRECTPDTFAGTSVFDDFADFSPLLQAKTAKRRDNILNWAEFWDCLSRLAELIGRFHLPTFDATQRAGRIFLMMQPYLEAPESL